VKAKADKAEKRVRRWLEAEFGKEFSEQQLDAGQRLGGTPGKKKFDAVSDSGQIVAMVKDYPAKSVRNLQGNRTRLVRVSHDLLLLHLVQADHKFMFLSAPFLQWFETTKDAVVPSDVKVRRIP